MTVASNPIRVLIVDDSAVVRGLWARLIDAEDDMRVVASAWNGRAALDVLNRKEVDIVLLDIEMPEMDGLTALPKILEAFPSTRVIMASTLTERGAEVTVRALSLGAADYVTKPQAAKPGADIATVGAELVRKIRALGSRAAPQLVGTARVSDTATRKPQKWDFAPTNRSVPPRAVAITSSTGGPNALTQVLSDLPDDFPLPIVIVQHMPPLFTAMLAERLQRVTGRPCSEATHGTVIEPGRMYMAPGGRHLTVHSEVSRVVARLTDGPPENFCRPSADPLFRSMASVYGPALLAVVLTGMGHDGLEGARVVVDRGGSVIAQDAKTSVVWGMPGAVAQAGLAQEVIPLHQVATKIDERIKVLR
jgi:two-component system, chemotaxis family, protein-glutamate methylesterase/glutaminase